MSEGTQGQAVTAGSVRVWWAVGAGFAGFLIMLIPAHAVFLFALLQSFTIFGSARVAPETWIIALGAVPVILGAAAALPAIALGAGVRWSLIAGYVGGWLAVVVFAVVSLVHPLNGLFGPSDALASITPVSVTVLAAILRPAAWHNRRTAAVLVVWAALSVMTAGVVGMTAASAAGSLPVDINSLLAVGMTLMSMLLVWTVLPAVAAADPEHLPDLADLVG